MYCKTCHLGYLHKWYLKLNCLECLTLLQALSSTIHQDFYLYITILLSVSPVLPRHWQRTALQELLLPPRMKTVTLEMICLVRVTVRKMRKHRKGWRNTKPRNQRVNNRILLQLNFCKIPNKFKLKTEYNPYSWIKSYVFRHIECCVNLYRHN